MSAHIAALWCALRRFRRGTYDVNRLVCEECHECGLRTNGWRIVKYSSEYQRVVVGGCDGEDGIRQYFVAARPIINELSDFSICLFAVGHGHKMPAPTCASCMHEVVANAAEVQGYATDTARYGVYVRRCLSNGTTSVVIKSASRPYLQTTIQ